MRSVLRVLLLVSAFSLLVCGGLFGGVRGASESEVVAVMDATESDILLCYSAVAAADKAGANVSTLLDRLFEAGEFLSLAELAFQESDFDSAFANASTSQVLLSGIVEEAEDLEEYTFNENYWSFMTDVSIMAVGTSAVVVGTIIVWFLLKRRSARGVG
jgi:hypothetical protein